MDTHFQLKSQINEEYWFKKLSGNLPRDVFPKNEYMGHEKRVVNREIIEVPISTETTNEFNRISNGSKLGRLILFLTTVSGLLYRYSGGGEILLGTTKLLNDKHDNEDGLLFLKCQAQGDKTWKEHNEAMKKEVSLTFNHKDIQINKIINTIENSLGRESNELWQIACIDDRLQIVDKELERFNLVIKLVDQEGNLKLRFEYNPFVYSQSIVKSFSENLLYCLDEFHKNIPFKLAEEKMDLLAPNERNFLLTELNQTNIDLTNVSLLHQLLEEQAKKTPDKIAVVENEKKISYRVLNEKANQLARTLKSVGVGSECVIGVIVQPTVEVIIAISAILKAGAAYCPIDPEFPKDRVLQIFTESGIDVLLSPKEYLSLFTFEGNMINISDPDVYIGDNTNLIPSSLPNNLAYVIYTSGSTGKPKGVMIEHRNIVNQVLGLTQLYSFDDTQNHILMAPFTFDPSIQQVFLPLSTGGTLHLVPNRVKTDPKSFWELIQTSEINVINTVPSLMELLLEQNDSVKHQIQYLILAGEVFTFDLAKRLEQKLEIEKLINIYGPTEATINTTLYEFDSKSCNNQVVPIGKPLLNYQVYVLDSQHRLLPFGVTGELFIGGTGLARGYMHNRELTETTFVTNAISNKSEKLYKTGDLVRWLPNGNLEFVGRKDQQIKIRGMRIELGEVEVVLSNSPWIKEVVVTKHEIENNTELVAFYTLNKVGDYKGEKVDAKVLKDYLKKHLPGYMIPSHFVYLDAMPVTSNGKINKNALPKDKIGEKVNRDMVSPRNGVETTLVEIWAKVLGVKDVSVNDSFFDAGGNSLTILRLQSTINKAFDLNLSIPDLFTYHSVTLQASFIQNHRKIVNSQKKKSNTDHINVMRDSDVAVIGMSCRFPLADGCDEFWDNLSQNVDTIRSIPEKRIRDVVGKEAVAKENQVKFPQAAYLEKIDGFDSQFFGISPNEARMMDPQQRLFLQVVMDSILDAGYSESDLYESKTGVFVGAGKPKYHELVPEGEPSAIPGNLYSVIAGRISYVLNLHGPSEVIDTACSSSLMAIHHAVREINSGNCELAIAGGVNLYMSAVEQTVYEMGIASPDGRSKSFDASADGTGGGEGIGSVLLKSLEKAIADGDHIYAVIKGTAANSDGRTNGITAPSAISQTNVIEEAWRHAGIDPSTVSYIETHGTGTRLGDPIEFEGISNAFKRYTERKQFCAIGSVKTNIGHLDSAAGIAGFIKTVLSLSKKQIPASLHFDNPNPHIDFINSPIYLNGALREWQPESGIRRAGVSSFGLSGTNCHVVLEEYHTKTEAPSMKEEYLFVLSAKSHEGLLNYVEKYIKFLGKTNNDLNDICYCTNISRGEYLHRLAIVANSLENLRGKLGIWLKMNDSVVDSSKLHNQRIYFNRIGEDGVNTIHYSTQSNDSFAAIIKSFIAGDLVDWKKLYADQKYRRISLPTYPFEEKRFWIENSTVVTKNKLTPKEAKGELSNFWSITESVFALGENILVESGFKQPEGYKKSVEQFAANLIFHFFQKFGMLINTDRTYTQEEIMSAIGVIPQYERLFNYLLNYLQEYGYIQVQHEAIVLNENVDHLNGEISEFKYLNEYPEFSGTFKILKYCLDNYPDVLTGKKSPLSVLFPDGTSNFLKSFLNKGRTWGDLYESMAINAIKQHIFANQGKPLKILEVGAGSGTIGRVLFSEISGQDVEYYYTDIGRSILLDAQKQFNQYPFVKYKEFNIEEDPFSQGFVPDEFDIIIGLNVIHATRNIRTTLSQLKKVISHDGALFIIEKVHNEPAENLVWGMTEGWWLFEDTDLRTHLPLIPVNQWESVLNEHFQEVKSFPLKKNNQVTAETSLIVGRMDKKSVVKSPQDLMYKVSWVEKDLIYNNSVISNGSWLIFNDHLGVGDELNNRLSRSNNTVIIVEEGIEYKRINKNHYLINPNSYEDYKQLLLDLENNNISICGIIHLWTCINESQIVNTETVDRCLQLGVYSLYYLTKAILHQEIKDILNIRIVSNLAYKISNESIISPEKAPIFGLAKVISQEHPKIQCFGLDIDTNEYSSEQIATTILNEINENKTDYLVGIRDQRFVQEMIQFKPNQSPRQDISIQKNGVYIVVGGAGGLGLEVSKYLAQKCPIKLVIINRTELPNRSEWAKLIIQHTHNKSKESVTHKLKAFLDIESNGSEINYYQGDVSDFNRMNFIFDDVRDKYGQINGVIHCAAASGETSKPLANQSIDDFRKVLLPKIHGTIVMDRLLEEEQLDFFVLYSSVASLWGGAGGGDYAAANVFMDVFSAYRNMQGKNTLSINWYAWEGLTGPGCMAYMSPAEALEAFDMSLTHEMDQIAIGKFNRDLLAEWAPMMKIQIADDILQTEIIETKMPDQDINHLRGFSKVDVILKGKKLENVSDLERKIAQVWAEVLGYEEINVYDNFFEIGGDSLLILKVLNLLNDRVDAELEAGDLFSYGTIDKLAAFIESKRNENELTNSIGISENENDDDLKRLIKSVKEDAISIEEAMKGFEKHER
ncbi:non-ribosomal peptide synthetase [Metabacillus idriensis]|uniref:non-ribosomal peptide synthetase n=1 Tax=Metabacillus idriensis TaxID=324768 RepID=UPI001749F52F|nr:non-ribosomal peptide synthetase [Metabacillus idriensis]